MATTPTKTRVARSPYAASAEHTARHARGRRPCALLAAAVLMVFLSRYRESVDSAAAPTPVLVATSLIQKGTSGDVIAEKRQFETVTRAAEDVKEGGIADPAVLAGKVATADIYPGQQITASSFVASTGTVLPKLADDQRAIAVPIDEAHGLVGQVQTGDHVDVLASYTTTNSSTGQGQGVVKTMLQDKLVLRAGAKPIEGSDEGNAADKSIILRVSDREAVVARARRRQREGLGPPPPGGWGQAEPAAGRVARLGPARERRSVRVQDHDQEEGRTP